MPKWSIHQEEDGKYAVRLNPEQVNLDKMPGTDPQSTNEEKAAKAAAYRGSQVGDSYTSQGGAVRKLEALEFEQRKADRIAAAKELLGV